MSSKFSCEKKIRQRVECAFSDISDFCEASRSHALTMWEHPKLFSYFTDRYLDVEQYFSGAVFRNDDCYWQILSDISFARDLIRKDNIHVGLVPHLEALLDDLVEMKKGDTDVVPS
jgi:hypothetical protein